MKKAAYDQRAKSLHGEKLNANYPPIPEMSREEYWREVVRSKEDVEQFYKIYYPELPDVMATALAVHIEKQVQGIIPPSENFWKHSELNKRKAEQRWDYRQDLKDEELAGKINLTAKRLDDLMNETQ